MAAKFEMPNTFKEWVALIGAVAGGYLAYTWGGGEPLPVLKTFVPWIAGGVTAVALWRHLNRG